MTTAADTALFNSNSYISFDANSIKSLIIDRLNQGQVFTDQNYEGSNFSAFIDVISYSFSTLLYYLNKTSSESMFSETQIYENMNRIVKLINYNPKGNFAQTLSFELSATSQLPAGNYIIPRYSYINIGPTKFSFANDIYFTNNANGIALFTNNKNDLFLYQGLYSEYPIYNAFGNDNEVLYIDLGTNTQIDHFNIDVYVKYASNNTWEQWNKTENLFLNQSTDKVFEVRYNPNQNYEIKFGNNINGKKLSPGDQVLVFYLEIDPAALPVASYALNASTGIVFYNSVNYQNIQNDVLYQPDINTILTTSNISYVTLTNTYPSNPYSQQETVEQIRNNAAKSFTFQQRLITADDYMNYIMDNYNNIISDVKVVNNDDYLNGHMKYLYDIGLSSPQLENRILYNQVKFSTSCNFNNIYVYMVPSNSLQKYLNASQKQFILNSVKNIKILTSELISMDPVYMYFDFYINDANSGVNINDIPNNKFLIYKKTSSNRSSSGILSEAINILTNAFSKNNLNLGQNIDINQLAALITSIDGVDTIKTFNSATNTYINGLSFLVWNENYPNLDANVYTQSIQLQYFQYPILNSINNLISRIQIVEQTGVVQITDY